VGSLERPQRAVDQVVFDPDDNSERCDFAIIEAKDNKP
jgi:hypothetical protein